MPVEETQLKSWMIAAQSGDKDAYHSLLIDLERMFRRFCLRLGVSSSDTDDVVQNALIAVHRSRQTYLSDRSFSAWAFAICRRKVYDHFRGVYKQQRQEIADESLLFALFTEESQENIPDLETPYETALEMLNGLPSLQKEIVTAIKVEGKRVREVATSLNMTESAVKTAAHRAYKKLQAIVKKMV